MCKTPVGDGANLVLISISVFIAKQQTCFIIPVVENFKYNRIDALFFMTFTQTFATLLAPDRSRALAEKFGISTPTEILSETKYRFKNNDKNLTVDLDNGNFSYNRVTTVSA